MTSSQNIFLILIFGIIAFFVFLIIYLLNRTGKFNSWVLRSNENDLRQLPFLRNVPRDWAIYTLAAPGVSDRWSIQRKNDSSSIGEGSLSVKLGHDDAAFRNSKFRIRVGNETQQLFNSGTLVINKEGEAELSWPQHRGTLTSLMDDQYPIFKTAYDNSSFSVHREKDHLELRKNNDLIGIVSMGAFDSRIAAIHMGTPELILLSFLYCSLMRHRGPTPKVPSISLP